MDLIKKKYESSRSVLLLEGEKSDSLTLSWIRAINESNAAEHAFLV